LPKPPVTPAATAAASRGGDGRATTPPTGLADAAAAAVTAPADAAPTAVLRRRRGAGQSVSVATGRRHKTALGPAEAPVAHIVAGRDFNFSLHVAAGGAVELAPPVVQVPFEEATGAPGEWRALAAGAQCTLRPGDHLRIAGVEYVCDLPGPLHQPAPPRPAAVGKGGDPPAASPSAGRAALAQELVGLATREAQVRSELTAGLSGAPLREAQRGLGAAHDAYVAVALGAGAAPEQRQQSLRKAAGTLKKTVNDGDKKRRREEVSHARAVDRAERRDAHSPPEARAKQPRHGAATPRVAKRDRRTFNARVEHRKVRRVGEDQRRQQQQPQRSPPPPPPPQQLFPSPSGKGRGKGGGGRGKGGGKGSAGSSSFGARGRGRVRGGTRGGGRNHGGWHGY